MAKPASYKPPVGYLTARERIEGREIRTVMVDPDRAPLVRWAFTAYATGDYTLRELTEELEQRGLKTEQTRKRPSHPLSLSTVNEMLSNRYYLGMVSYEGVLYQGRHQPLIDEATFEAVQALMAARRVSGEKPKQHPHYLKGRLFCGYCGSRMGVSFSRSQNGTRYPYFYCIGRQKRKNCPQTFVPMETIEQAAIDHWRRNVQLDEQRTAEIRKVVMDWLLTRQATSGKTIAAERRRIEKLDREQAKLTQAYLAETLPLEVLKTEKTRVQRELAQARLLIGRYEEDYQAIEAALDEALLMCRYGSLAYEYAGPETRRQLIQAAFDKLWVVGAEIAGCDLKPGYVTMLDEDLVAELERQAGRSDGAEPDSAHVHYRHAPSPARQSLPTASTRNLQRITAERPAGQLPWEAKDTKQLVGVSGANVADLVGATGFEPVTPLVGMRWVQGRWWQVPRQLFTAATVPAPRQCRW